MHQIDGFFSLDIQSDGDNPQHDKDFTQVLTQLVLKMMEHKTTKIKIDFKSGNNTEEKVVLFIQAGSEHMTKEELADSPAHKQQINKTKMDSTIN